MSVGSDCPSQGRVAVRAAFCFGGICRQWPLCCHGEKQGQRGAPGDRCALLLFLCSGPVHVCNIKEALASPGGSSDMPTSLFSFDALLLSFSKGFIFYVLFMCISVCTCMQLPTEARRGLLILWSWSYRWLNPPDIDAGNPAWVLCKGSALS